MGNKKIILGITITSIISMGLLYGCGNGADVEQKNDNSVVEVESTAETDRE